MTPQDPLRYESIEAQIVERLPELRPAAERYWEREGPPGQDSGPYIFVGDLFAKYVEVLLAMGESRVRDYLLARAFELLDAMLASADRNVRDLAFIEFLENADPWWLGRATSFLGSKAQAELKTYNSDWPRGIDVKAASDLERDIIDLFGIRDVVMAEIGADVVGDRDVPGISAPREWQTLPSLEVAREVEGAVVFVACYGTSRPYVVAPARQVLCDADTLRRLAADLATRDGEEPDQKSKAGVYFFPIRTGERVWQMNHEKADPHARWEGVLWISRRVKELGLEPGVREVLAGSRLSAIDRE